MQDPIVRASVLPPDLPPFSRCDEVPAKIPSSFGVPAQPKFWDPTLREYKIPRPENNGKVLKKLQFGPPGACPENYRKLIKSVISSSHLLLTNYTFIGRFQDRAGVGQIVIFE